MHLVSKQGPGFEPGTLRTTAGYSTTELYTEIRICCDTQNKCFSRAWDRSKIKPAVGNIVSGEKKTQMSRNQDRECQGLVAVNAHQVRPCKNSGQTVQDNGFCSQHQNQASQHIIHQLDLLADELHALSGVKGAVNLTQLADVQNRIADTKAHLKKTQTLCSHDDECQARMRGITVGVRELISPDGEKNSMPAIVIEDPNTGLLSEHPPLARLEEINRNVESLSRGTTGDDSLALDVIRNHELARRQGRTNQVKLQQIRSEYNKTTAAAQAQELQFQKGLQQVSTELQRDRAHIVKVEEASADLTTRLDQCRSRSMQLQGEYAEGIQVSKDEVGTVQVNFQQ